MSRELTLLERIESGARPSQDHGVLTAKERIESLMESVRRNLARLLNSRHGMSEAQPDYGLPALSDLTFAGGGAYAEMEESILTAIQRYEPRLRRVRVSRVVDEELRQGTLAFRIEGVLAGRTGEHRVRYQTKLVGNGRFDVDD